MSQVYSKFQVFPIIILIKNFKKVSIKSMIDDNEKINKMQNYITFTFLIRLKYSSNIIDTFIGVYTF